MSQSPLHQVVRRGWQTAAGLACLFALAILPAARGATDSNLFIRTIRFKQLWSTTNADTFSITGQINPRGATNDLSAATLSILSFTNLVSAFDFTNAVSATSNFVTVVLSTNAVPAALGFPVPLNAAGQGTLSTNGMVMNASFNGYSGQYAFSISHTDLRGYTQVPNATGLGTLEPTLILDIEGADLAISTPTNIVLMPDASLSNQYTRGLFIYGEHLCGPLFESLQTTAMQQGTNFVLNFNGVIVPDDLFTTNADITITISNKVITIPGKLVKIKNRGTFLPDGSISTNQGFAVRAGGVPDLSKFSIIDSRRTFQLGTKAITDTGIPLAGAGAPTSYDLPLQLQIPGILFVSNFFNGDSVTNITGPVTVIVGAMTNIVDCETNVIKHLTNVVGCVTNLIGGVTNVFDQVTNITFVVTSTNSVTIPFTNSFSTIIELKRPTATTTRWAR